MDRSLDEIIGERPSRPRGGGGRGRGARGRIDGDRRPPPARAPRREEYPRDGVRKYRRDEPASLDSEWVHDRYEDDRYDRQRRAPLDDRERMYGPRGGAPGGGKLRIDNVHYELTEDDLSELFERVGPVAKVNLQYDRQDRSTGTAWVVYDDERDARDALSRFDGCNANGQPIRITLMPVGPAPRPLADRMERPARSLFERIESSRDDSRDDGRRRRQRSDSPRKATDSYMPGGRGERSPIRRRGTPRGGGRRPGERREERGGRGGRGGGGERKSRVDEEGRPLVGGRPRKTAEELDAEMNDYWGSKNDASAGESNGQAAATNGGDNGAVGDIDMDI